MATADLTVIGLGRPEVSASPYVAEIQRRLADQRRDRPEQTLADKVRSVRERLG